MRVDSALNICAATRRGRRHMGDKGGKKDKDKSKEQQAKKQDQKKQDKSGPRVAR